MPFFEYTALGAGGEKVVAVHEAPDRKAMAGELRARGLYVLKIDRAAGPAQRTNAAPEKTLAVRIAENLRPVGPGDAAAVFRQVSLMLRSGLTLLDALDVCGEQTGKAALRVSLKRIANAIQSGSSFSAATEKERKIFPSISAKMIAAGEMSGELDVVLERLAGQIERRIELKGTLLGAMVYPALVVLITVGVVSFLMIKVIPKFTQILSARNIALPATTQTLVDVSAFVNENGAAILTAFAAATVLLLAGYATRRGRVICDRLLLFVPIIGKTVLISSVAHFGRTTALLLKSGIPIMDALRIMSQSIGNRAIALEFEAVENGILEGRSFSLSLKASLMPRMAVEVVKVGEMTGALDGVLDDLGGFYEERLRKRVKWMSTIFEPLMILIVGGIVGFVYFAFFQVLFQISGR